MPGGATDERRRAMSDMDTRQILPDHKPEKPDRSDKARNRDIERAAERAHKRTLRAKHFADPKHPQPGFLPATDERMDELLRQIRGEVPTNEQ